MATIDSVTLDVPDTGAAQAFYDKAFGLADALTFRQADPPPTGFRGYTLSLVVAQPGTVDALAGTALDAGATTLKPVRRSFWGYGGVLRAPDGAIWKIASSAKKDTGPATREIDQLVLLLGVADVKASKRFYEDRGVPVGKSFGGKYVEFDTPGSAVKLALYGRRALAKDAGVDADGDPQAPHGITVVGGLGELTDPDGFGWVGPEASAG